MGEEKNRGTKEIKIREFVETAQKGSSVKQKASRAKREYAMKNRRFAYREFFENRQTQALFIYAVCVLAEILTGVFVFENPVVWVCVLAVIETLLAVCFHHLPVWIHAAVISVEVIAGIVFEQLLFAGVLACLYLAAIFSLRFIMRRE